MIPLKSCSYFGNSDGKLVCDTLPPGDYQSSCKGCRFSETEQVLACDTCGTMAPSSPLNVNGCAEVGLEGNRLFCKRKITAAPPKKEEL
mmetsp:Transcript_24390/g.56462  ORF Transcript_24390/g.56462 Transcript_24390/m.56462 type:complete len:89 (+) Transcript_24390:356-622(+)